MSKATTIKEALAKFEEKEGKKTSECSEVNLISLTPPIEKMDASLSTLAGCIKLSLSTNCIEKIANLNGLKNLKILSLGRNKIKSFTGLEVVGETLEELWISHNFIEKLNGLNALKKLKILYMSNNKVSDHAEFLKLRELPCLIELVFVGNPLEENWPENLAAPYREDALKNFHKLEKLDGVPLVREEEQ